MAGGGISLLHQHATDEIKVLCSRVQPGEELKGGTVVPPDWARRYKPQLGTYKKFVETLPEEFTIIQGDKADNFFVTLSPSSEFPLEPRVTEAEKRIAAALAATQSPPGGLPAPGGPGHAAPAGLEPWGQPLRTAWIEYCAVTPAALRDVGDFLRPVWQAASLYQKRLHSRSGVAAAATGAPALPESGPQPEAVRILVAKYGLAAGTVHHVLGATRLTWKLEGGKSVPLEQEGLCWERARADEVGKPPSLALANGDANAGELSGPPPAPEPPWVVMEHPEQPGSYYYFNEETAEALWQLPSESARAKKRKKA